MIAVKKAYFVQLSVAEITMFVFQRAPMSSASPPRKVHGIVMYEGVVVPRDVDAGVATVQTKRTIEFHAAGDVAKCLESCA